MTSSKAWNWPAPLRDAGTVEFAAEDWDAFPRVREIVRTCCETCGLKGLQGGRSLRYASDRQLLQLLHRLQMKLEPKEGEAIRVRFGFKDERQAWKPLAAFFETVGGRGVSEYILHRCFTIFLQPIVQPSGQVAGYECLTRPLPEQAPFRPAELFEKARKTGLHAYLDREARHAAIRMTAAHLPPGIKRFINFLPSSLYRVDSSLEETLDWIRETATDPGDIVFEVVETEPLDHPEMVPIFHQYRREGFRMAVDDVGTGYATEEMIDRLKPDYVKLDRRFVSGCDADPEKQRHIDSLLERVSRFHGVVLAEGVEREQEWQYLRRAGVPLLQGYWFGSASPVPMQSPLALSQI